MIIDILFTVTMLIGGIILFFQKEKFIRYPITTILLLYFFLMASLYLIVIALSVQDWWFIAPLVLFLIFFQSWIREKRRVVNGFLFDVFLFVYFFYIMYLRILNSHLLLNIAFNIGVVFIVILLVFGFVALMMFLFINAHIVKKKENAGLANRLTLLVGIFLLLIQVLQLLGNIDVFPEFPWYVNGVLNSSTTILGYYFLLFVSYLSASILYNFSRPKLNKEYIVVLGAGLIDGRKVTPLLHQRIVRAIEFSQKQKRLTDKLPKLVMSGGQGADEVVSEAQAMYEDAVASGYPKENILLEDQSTTTYENMKFSKAIIMSDSGKNHSPTIFSTNNYHLLRAGIYARKAGVCADGIGAKTARYFIPNGFLREFVAYVLMRKKTHLTVMVLLVVFSVLSAYIQHIAVLR